MNVISGVLVMYGMHVFFKDRDHNEGKSYDKS